MIGLLLSAALAGPVTLPDSALNDAQIDEALRPRRLALLIGPESFRSEFAPLRYTDDDARALGKVLSDPTRGGFDVVRVLTGPQATTLEGVLAALSDLQAQARGSEDTVFVYFSTHGTLEQDAAGQLQQYLVLSDTRLSAIERTGLAVEELARLVEALPSRRKVLMLATCHSGRGKSAFAPHIKEALEGRKGVTLPPLRQVSEAVVMIGVCALHEEARESEALGHDIYTWYFLEGLEQGDADGDGAVTVTEAHDHARARTFEHTQGAQRAYLRAEITGVDPIVLSGEASAPARPSLLSYSERLDGYALVVDGESKGVLPGQIVLEPGRHTVELLEPERGRVVARRRVTLEGDGQRMGLDELVRQDRARLGVGAGAVFHGGPVPDSAILRGEAHLPLKPPWDLIAHGEVAARWPRPSLTGGIGVERALVAGMLQPRVGLSLEGLLLMGPDLISPSLVPMPTLALAWLPSQPYFLRLGATGGYVWSTDGQGIQHDWMVRGSLVVGSAY